MQVKSIFLTIEQVKANHDKRRSIDTNMLDVTSNHSSSSSRYFKKQD
jgi:hypothetical protein